MARRKKTKANFSIYPLNTLNFKKLMVKSGIKSARKKSIPELAGEIFKMLKHSSLDHHLCATETLWFHEGKNVLFLPNGGFVDDLLKATYHMDGDAVLSLPHSTFILAMPHFIIDEVFIPSVIVNFCTAENRIERYNTASRLMNVKEFTHDQHDIHGYDSVSFFYQCPYNPRGVYVQTNLSMKLVAAALEADSPAEYAEVIGKIPKDMVSSVAIDTTEKDSKIQYAITKLIVGLSVFLSANDKARLVEGLPGDGKISVSNFKRDAPYSFSHLHTGEACEGNYVEGMGVRRFFFRNLKNKRFYRGQYAKIKAGSRWVFVRQAKIGQYRAEHIEESSGQ